MIMMIGPLYLDKQNDFWVKEVKFMKVSVQKSESDLRTQFLTKDPQQVSSIQQEMGEYEPWDVMAVLDVLLANIAFNMNSEAMYLSLLATQKQVALKYDDILIKLAERMDTIRNRNYVSRM